MITTAQNNINWADPEIVNKYNLLTPINVSDERDPFRKSVISIVKIDSLEANGDVYPTPKHAGKMSLTKSGILKIAAVASMQIEAKIDYIDKESAIFSAKCSYSDYSGQPRIGTAIKESKRGPLFSLEMGETKAILRAIRQLLAIKQGYTVEELKKPFAVGYSIYAPDYRDPQVKQIALQKFAQESNILFGGSSENIPQIEAPKEETPTALPMNTPDPSTGEIQESSPPQVQTPPPVQPPVATPQTQEPSNPMCTKCGGYTTHKEGVKQETGKPWSAYFCDANCGATPQWTTPKAETSGSPDF